MRIVSLLPSLTEIVWALGLEHDLVAVTHECDYPPQVRNKPRVTRSLLPPGLSHADIDAAVRARLAAGQPLYALDRDLLAELRPDLILTQALCPVCAVSVDDVCRIAASLPHQPQVVSVEPTSLGQIFDSIETVGAATGRSATARAIVRALERRLAWLRERVVPFTDRPRVVCLEWLDPPIVAGHWVPEMVAMAGGHDVLGLPGRPSFTVDWEQVVTAAPEVLILMPCGYDADETRELALTLLPPTTLARLPATERGAIWAVDASSYFSRPGPRILHGVEILASLLHPECRPLAFGRDAVPVSFTHPPALA